MKRFFSLSWIRVGVCLDHPRGALVGWHLGHFSLPARAFEIQLRLTRRGGADDALQMLPSFNLEG